MEKKRNKAERIYLSQRINNQLPILNKDQKIQFYNFIHGQIIVKYYFYIPCLLPKQKKQKKKTERVLSQYNQTQTNHIDDPRRFFKNLK